MRKTVRATLLSATVLAAAAPCLAQDEGGRPTFRVDADRRFGRGGVVRTIRVGGVRMNQAGDARLDSDGRILIAGSQLVTSRRDDFHFVPLVARLLPNGRLDPSFGQGGVAALPSRGIAAGLSFDGRGRIVVGLWADGSARAAAARLEADGSLDPSFSEDGLFEPPPGEVLQMYWFRARPSDDSILAVVERPDRTQGLVRISADGTPDPDYAGDGFAELPKHPRDFEVDSRGRAVVTAPVSGVVRFAADGSPDSAFGAGGRLADADGAAVFPTILFIDGRDRIVVHGETPDVVVQERFTPGLRRFLEDGAPDPTFGEDGFAPTPRGGAGGTVSQTALGASAQTGRVVVASVLTYREAGTGRAEGSGWMARLFDRATPQRVATYVTRDPRPRRGTTRGFPRRVLVTEDGAAAYVVGADLTERGGDAWPAWKPFVVRLDLSRATRRAALGLAVEWVEGPRIVPGQVTQAAFEASFRVRNLGRGAAPAVRALVFLSSDDVLDATDRAFLDLPVPRLGAGATLVIALPHEGFGVEALQRGRRLVVALQSDTGDLRRRVAASPPIE
jgi:uncharacterized delta-60 repeat protein